MAVKSTKATEGADFQQERYHNLWRLHQVEGALVYSLAVFGDVLAKRENYKGLDGMDAVHFYLIQKFHWLPRDVKSMSAEDIRFVLDQEMQGFVLPKLAIFRDND